MVWPDRCIECQICASVCPNSSISVLDSSIVTERDKCEVCGVCAEKCPASAREIVGKRFSVDELMQEVEKDRPFYDKTGGITVSGGEPLSQPVFLHAFLRKCKKKGIHTTVDTSGYADRRIFIKISKDVDLFLYDLKVMDNKKHELYTGVSNRQIFENLELLHTLGKNLIIRFPLIPHVNSSKANISAMCEFISRLKNIEKIDVLPYHGLGVEKARRLGKEVKIFTKPTTEMLSQSLRSIRSYGFIVKTGG